jgi:pimeloyl-ACP methyl ester carboxylesterase
MRITSIVAAALVAVTLDAGAQGSSSTGYVGAEGSRIYYEECGRGPKLILLHDGSANTTTWDAVWPLLCERFHVVRYDRRGLGRSDAPTKSFAQTDDLHALMLDRRIPRATIVGSSAGGAIAIDYALAHPERVERLVLVGAVVGGLRMSDYFAEEKAASMEAAAAGRRYDPALERRPAVPAVARLGEVRVPTLILVGESDIADVHAHAGAIELGIWGARREVIRKAGHLVQGDQPGVLRDRIVAFIEESPIVSVPEKRLRVFVGTWRSPAGQGDFIVRNGRLTLRLPGEPELPFFPSSDSTFYALIWQQYKVNFRSDSAGRLVADIIVGDRRATAVRTSTRPGRER